MREQPYPASSSTSNVDTLTSLQCHASVTSRSQWFFLKTKGQLTNEADHVGRTIASIKAADLGSCLPKHGIVCCYLQHQLGVKGQSNVASAWCEDAE